MKHASQADEARLMYRMKAAIKREQSQTCLSYAEREQPRRSQKMKNEEWKVKNARYKQEKTCNSGANKCYYGDFPMKNA